MHLQPNTTLQGGKYRINRFISSGGFGCTYEAEHVTFGERVAVKEFFVKDFCNRDEVTAHVTVGTQSKKRLVDKLKRKFIEEAKMLYHMKHPNIVRVFDVFEENGTAYFVMDYIDGPSLNDIVNKEKALSEARALRYIWQVAEALRYVHENNRLHLDIKPSNIMVNSDDQAILIDFGASKQYDEMEGENTSTLIGKTPGYAPLEQMGNDVVKFMPATDIYALAATLYKLLTGVTPLSANLLASGEELEPLPKNISAATRRAIMAAMNVNKNKRPQTVEIFLALLGGGINGINSKETEFTNEEETLIVGDSKRGGKVKNPIVETIKPTSDGIEASKKKRNVGIASVIILVFVLIIVGINKSKMQQYTHQNTVTIAQEHQKAEANTPLYIKTSPVSALVYIDGVYCGATPIDGKEISRGTHDVKLSKDGYEDKKFTLTFGDNPVVINETLTKIPQSKDNLKTLLYITTTPTNVSVYMDGRYIGATPIEGEEITRGSHKIALRKDAYQEKVLTRTFGDKPVVLNETMVKTPPSVPLNKPEAKRNYEMGLDYYWGRNGTKVDYIEAVKCFRKAIEQGNTMAMHNLGMCYENGHGVQKSESEAVRWYRKAADQGEVASTYALERLGY